VIAKPYGMVLWKTKARAIQDGIITHSHALDPRQPNSKWEYGTMPHFKIALAKGTQAF